MACQEEDLDELSHAAEVRSLPVGSVICREGEQGDAIYVIVQGRVEIVRQMTDDLERHLHERIPGGVFGEIPILQQGVRTATVLASEPAIVQQIGQPSFLTVVGCSPSLGTRILVKLTNRLRHADLRSIAELRQANKELYRTLQKLARLDRTKSDFIQVSAHELRPP